MIVPQALVQITFLVQLDWAPACLRQHAYGAPARLPDHDLAKRQADTLPTPKAY